jgi:hypothetical protein
MHLVYLLINCVLAYLWNTIWIDDSYSFVLFITNGNFICYSSVKWIGIFFIFFIWLKEIRDYYFENLFL